MWMPIKNYLYFPNPKKANAFALFCMGIHVKWDDNFHTHTKHSNFLPMQWFLDLDFLLQFVGNALMRPFPESFSCCKPFERPKLGKSVLSRFDLFEITLCFLCALLALA